MKAARPSPVSRRFIASSASQIGAQVITLRTHRRQGIGSALLNRVCEYARERGDTRVCGQVDLAAHPEAEPFLRKMGFVPSSSIVRAEGGIDGAGHAVLALRDRLAARGKIPADAQIVETRGLPISQVLTAYRELIAEHLPGRPELAQYIVTSRGFDAALLTVGDRTAGMLAGTRNDGRGVSDLSAIAVAPEFRGGWGWANIVLMAYAFELAAAAGASRLRFEIDETNWNVLQGVGRVEGKILSVSARFVRELDGDVKG